MKDRILRYLRETGKGVSAGQILEDVFNFRAANVSASDAVLAGFLEQDPQFVFSDGVWNISSIANEPNRDDVGQVAVVHLRIPNHPAELQGLCGAVRLMDGRLQDLASATSAKSIAGILDEIGNHRMVIWSSLELRILNRWLQLKGQATWHGETVYLRNLAARALEQRPSKLQPEDLASKLSILPVDWERSSEVVLYMYQCWTSLLDRVPDVVCTNADSLRQWVDGPDTKVDFSRFAFGPAFLRELPRTPGVYVMRDREGTVIYVGKSRNLKSRISSYFASHARCSSKIERIRRQLYSIEVQKTKNEIEALLLEMRLIKGFHPVINLQIKVHERRADSNAARNHLLFIVDTERGRVSIYLFRDGIFSGRQSASLGRPAPMRLREKIRLLYFSRSKRKGRKGKTWEKEIVSRWFKANEKRMNYLDIDDAGKLATAIERLERYLNDPDQLARKVYYR